MAHQIHVAYTTEDGRAGRVFEGVQSLGAIGRKVKDVRIVDTYTIDAKLTQRELEKVAATLHTPLSQTKRIDKSLGPKRFSFVIEVGFLPGVTDNIGNTAKETIQDTLRRAFANEKHVYSSRLYFVSGKLSKKDVHVLMGSLYNPLIQRATAKSFREYKRNRGMGVVLPRVSLSAGPVTTVNLYVTDEELALLGKKGILDEDGTRRGPLGVDLDELKVIRAYFHRKGRKPTDIEIETIAQTWSEHCKHTIFANPLDDIPEGIYRRYIKRATKEIRRKKGKKDFCVSVFSDNSGVIKFDKDTYITHKVETHNTPSALDPFGGAITGIVGVNRDTIGTGMGAKPILNMYGYCLADPDDRTHLWRDKDKTEEMLSAKRIMDGVIEGVNAGGNQSGIPTPQGFLYFEPRYRGKPLVFVGTVGILPKRVAGKPSYEKGARPGDYIVIVGGRVGLDGIHGATFSSEALDSGSPATAVQIGDPITQKKFSDALVKEARDRELFRSVTDNGAGGLSSSVGEMARESGGCTVDLNAVPVKYPGLAPWQMWISESQERMTLAVPKKKWSALKKLMDSRGCEATVIGEFTNSGVCRVLFDDEPVLELGMDFLHEGNPVHMQQSSSVEPRITIPPSSQIKKAERELEKTLLSFLTRGNIGGFEFISSQYDHEVQGVSVTKPLHGRGRVNASASVSRPHTHTHRGVVLSQGLCPRYSDLDTYHMAASAIDQAVRNVVAAGGDPDYIALLDNFCWCSSDEGERLYQLKRAAEACYDYAVGFQTPFISGKDSMFNDFKGFDSHGRSVKISVPPTLLISSIAVLKDVRHAVTLDAKQVGDLVYLLGETKAELGGSEYFDWLGDRDWRTYTGEQVPTVDAKKNMALYKKYHRAVQKDLVASGLALDRGGLAVALMKAAIGGQLGMQIDVRGVGRKNMSVSEKLFSESNGRLLVTIAPENKARFERALSRIRITKLGTVTDVKNIVITEGGNERVNISLKAATAAYRSKFKDA